MKQYRETNSSLTHKSITDLSLYIAGFEKCDSSYSYGPSIRQYTVIHFVLSGKGKLHIENNTFNIAQNQGFIIPANKVAYYEADSNDPWTYIWIGYLGINANNYTYQLMNASSQVYVFSKLNVEKYRKLIFKIIDVDSFSLSLYLKTNSLLLMIFAELFEDLSIKRLTKENVMLVDEIKFYIDINYSDKLTVTDLANEFSIHPNYLSRIFSQKFDISPKKYILNLKLSKSCDLLKSTSLPISVISNSLSFTDQLAFSKIFKNKYNLSPTIYRKMNKN